MVDAAVLEKLEAGFKKLEAATDCKSLLKKYLSKDIFDKLKGQKTSLGATLLDVIQSGKKFSSNSSKEGFVRLLIYTDSGWVNWCARYLINRVK